MSLAVALWIVVPLGFVHWCVRRQRALLLFQVLVDVGLVLLPGRWLLQGAHVGPGAPDGARWGMPATVAGSPEQSDFPLEFAAWWDETRRLASAGEPPWVSDRLGVGTPLYAHGQTQIPFPLHAPVWALGSERGTDVMVVWKLEFAALGGFLLLRRLRLLPVAAATGALAYAFGLSSVSWLVVPLSWVMAAAPWVFWAMIGALRGRRRDQALLALLLGISAGWSIHPETGAFLWLAIGLAGAVLAFGRWRRVTRLGMAFGVAIAVAGLGALPTVLTVRDSGKLVDLQGGLVYRPSAVTWSLRARVAALLLDPGREGQPADGTWQIGFPAVVGALGVGSVALVCLVASRPRRRLRRHAAALGAIGGLAAILFFQIPGPAHVLARVPVLGIMVWPRAGFLIGFAIAFAAAIAVDTAMRRGARLRLVVAACALEAVVLALAGTAPRGAGHHPWLTAWAPAATAAVVPFVGGPGAWLLPVVALAEASTASWAVIPASGMRPPPPPVVVELRRHIALEGGRILGLGAALAPNLAVRLGFADLRAHDPVRSGALTRLHQALGSPGLDLPGPVETPWAGLCGAWGIRWLVTPQDGIRGPAAAGWEEVFRDGNARIYRNTRALAPLRIAERVSPPNGDPGRGGWEGVDFATTAVVSGDAVADGRGTLELVTDRPAQHAARVRTEGTVLAVLHVPHAPGWHALLDGRRAPIVIADIAGMGVAVGPGEHEVRWVYSPPGLTAGGVLTLAGLIACAILFRQDRRRRL